VSCPGAVTFPPRSRRLRYSEGARCALVWAYAVALSARQDEEERHRLRAAYFADDLAKGDERRVHFRSRRRLGVRVGRYPTTSCKSAAHVADCGLVRVGVAARLGARLRTRSRAKGSGRRSP